jgi:two-component system, NarL family, sensor histidine kinase DesK
VPTVLTREPAGLRAALDRQLGRLLGYRGPVPAAASRWQSRASAGLHDAGRPRALSTVAAALFTLSMVPAWLYAIGATPPDLRVPAVVVCVVYAVAGVVAVPLARRSSLPVQVGVCVTLLGLGLVLVGLCGLDHSWILLSALGIVATLMPIAVTAVVTGLTAGGLLVLAWVTGTVAEQFSNMVVIVAVTTAAALIVHLVELNAELREARGQVAALAVTRERERIARDLHDILGHSLTTVALKAGLARRVLEAGDAERSAVQIRDVERLVQQALTDLRATVSDYKEITLAAELAVGAEVLRAAGVSADLPTASDTVDSRLQGVFGFVLREALTNVVRHGSARHVVVRLTEDSITISNDGPVDGPVVLGNGLRGLEERMAAVGGALEAGPGPDGGFVVRAVAPRADAGAAGRAPAGGAARGAAS